VSTARALPRSRDWRLLFGAYVASAAGSELTTIALLVHAHELGVSLTSVVAVVLAQVVPSMVVGPVAGAVADRWAKRGLLAGLHFAAAPVALALAFATTAPALLVLAAALAALTSSVRPAEVAWEPQLLPDREELFAAAGIRTGARDLLSVLGPAAAGVLVAIGGSAAAFVVDAGTYVLAGALFLAIRSNGAPVGHDGAAAAERAGPPPRRALPVIWESPLLRPVVVAFAAVVLVTSLQPPVLYVFVRQDLVAGPAFYGLLLAAMGAGSLCASVALVRGRALPTRARLRIVALVLPFDGLALIVLGTSRTAAVVCVCAFAMGALGAVFGSLVRYTVQIATDDGNRGRVFGLLFAVQGPAQALSLLAVPIVGGGTGRA
jgi:MFS family permease